MPCKLKDGVITLHICDSDFVFPTSRAGFRIHMLYPVTKEVISYFNNNSEQPETDISEETKMIIKRLLTYGLAEEY